MKRLPPLLALALALTARAEGPAKPDLILLVLDSVRADHVTCNGYHRETTPVLDAFAKTGANFTQAVVSGSWTQPSVMSLFTSLPPDLHGRVHWSRPHDAGAATLAGILRDAGYQTVGITANTMSNRRFGFDKGFDHYDDYTVALRPDVSLSDISGQAATSPVLNRLAEGWLERRDPDRPLFLFIFYMDPHWDYHPPADYYALFTDDPIPARKGIGSLDGKEVSPAERARIVAAYDGEIRYTDTHVGHLLKTIENSPRGKNTAIAICADHGEAFWERGLIVAHGSNLHEEEIRVPLMIRGPEASGDAFAKGTVIKEQVGLIDLAPTFLDFAGITPPEVWHGKSLRPALSGTAVPERPLVLDTRVTPKTTMRGVRTSRYKITARPPFTELYEAYDLQADPKELNNLVKSGAPLPEAATALIPLLKPREP